MMKYCLPTTSFWLKSLFLSSSFVVLKNQRNIAARELVQTFYIRSLGNKIYFSRLSGCLFNQEYAFPNKCMVRDPLAVLKKVGMFKMYPLLAYLFISSFYLRSFLMRSSCPDFNIKQVFFLDYCSSVAACSYISPRRLVRFPHLIRYLTKYTVWGNTK